MSERGEAIPTCSTALYQRRQEGDDAPVCAHGLDDFRPQQSGLERRGSYLDAGRIERVANSLPFGDRINTIGSGLVNLSDHTRRPVNHRETGVRIIAKLEVYAQIVRRRIAFAARMSNLPSLRGRRSVHLCLQMLPSSIQTSATILTGPINPEGESGESLVK